LTEAYTEFKKLPDLPSALAEFETLFERYQVNDEITLDNGTKEKNVITRRIVMHDDPMLKSSLVFNRTDLYWPFTVPVNDFLQHKPGNVTTVRANIIVRLTPSRKGLELTPKISHAYDGWVAKEQTLPLFPSRPIPGAGDDGEDVYIWSRTFSMPNDVLIQSPSNPKNSNIVLDPMSSGFIPGQMFTRPSGFCSWTKFEIDKLPPPIHKLEGSLEVAFGYNRADHTDAIKFTNTLHFTPDKGKVKWTVSILLYSITFYLNSSVGSLHIMKDS
jgi:hypothetical protein